MTKIESMKLDVAVAAVAVACARNRYNLQLQNCSGIRTAALERDYEAFLLACETEVQAIAALVAAVRREEEGTCEP